MNAPELLLSAYKEIAEITDPQQLAAIQSEKLQLLIRNQCQHLLTYCVMQIMASAGKTDEDAKEAPEILKKVSPHTAEVSLWLRRHNLSEKSAHLYVIAMMRMRSERLQKMFPPTSLQ